MFCGTMGLTSLGVHLLRCKDLIGATILILEDLTNGEAAKALVFFIYIYRKYFKDHIGL